MKIGFGENFPRADPHCFHIGTVSCRNPGFRIFEDDAILGGDSDPFGALQENVGSGFGLSY